MNEAVSAISRHRYGTATSGGPVTATAATTTSPLTQAGHELHQWLKSSGIPVAGQSISGPTGIAAYIFRFKIPIDHLVAQIGPGVLTIGSRHGIPVTLLTVHQPMPQAVVVLGSGDIAKQYLAQRTS